MPGAAHGATRSKRAFCTTEYPEARYCSATRRGARLLRVAEKRDTSVRGSRGVCAAHP